MRELLSGNEAVARGAYEAGVKLAAAYLGTPSTEILETLAAQYRSIYSQWSPNEKVAFEVAIGASIRLKRNSIRLLWEYWRHRLQRQMSRGCLRREAVS